MARISNYLWPSFKRLFHFSRVPKHTKTASASGELNFTLINSFQKSVHSNAKPSTTSIRSHLYSVQHLSIWRCLFALFPGSRLHFCAYRKLNFSLECLIISNPSVMTLSKRRIRTKMYIVRWNFFSYQIWYLTASETFSLALASLLWGCHKIMTDEFHYDWLRNYWHFSRAFLFRIT